MKRFFLNCFLILFSLVLFYGALEFFIFERMLTYVPLKLHFAVREELRVLVQSSKEEDIPQQYTALFGDSYSQGYGDWLLDSSPNRNQPYHSAHVLHELSDKEIITFGKSGSGSLSGLVGNPINWMDYIRRSRLKELPVPEEIFVYFYEGNDLNDNLADLKARYIERNYDPSRVYDETYFRSFIEKEVLKKSRFENPDWTDYLFFTDFIKKTFDSFETGDAKIIGPDDISPEPGQVNRARINGEEVSLPDGLQSPALELTPGEVHLTVYMFKQSLKFMRHHFTNVPVTVVYLPSVLSCYEITSPYVDIQVYDKGRDNSYPSFQVEKRGDKIATMIRSVAEQEGAQFLDARPALRKLGRQQVLHGPKDWKHYNKDGYTTLATTVNERMMIKGTQSN